MGKASRTSWLAVALFFVFAFVSTAAAGISTAYDAPIQVVDAWNSSSGGRLVLLLDLNASLVPDFMRNYTNFTFTANGTPVTAWNVTGPGGQFFNETNFTFVSAGQYSRHNVTLNYPYTRERIQLNITANTTGSIPVQRAPLLNILNIHVLDNSGAPVNRPIMVSRVNASKALVTGGYGVLATDYDEEENELPRPFMMLPKGILEFHCFGANGTCDGTEEFYTAHAAQGYHARAWEECMSEQDELCPINDISDDPEGYPVSFQFFDMSTYNLSAQTTFTPATQTAPVTVYINGTTGIMPNLEMESIPSQNCQGGPCEKSFNITYLAVFNSTGSLVFNNTNYNPNMPMPQMPLAGGRSYSVEIAATPASSFGKHTYLIYAKDAGFANFNLRLWNSSGGRTAFKGQALYSNGTAMPDAYVFLLDAFNSGPMLNIINSTRTDSSGLFSVYGPRNIIEYNCPEDGGCPHLYKLMIQNPAKNSSGANLYYPTEDNNAKKNYKAAEATVVIPPITVRDGGTVRVNVTLGGAGMVWTELSHYTTNVFGTVIRDIVSKAMDMGDLSEKMSSAAKNFSLAYLDSPNTSVTVSVFGSSMGSESGPPEQYSMCKVSATVGKGNFNDTACALANFSKIGILLKRCGSLFNPTDAPSGSCQNATPISMQGAGENIWWEMRAQLKNATSGELSLYVDEDSDYLYSLDGKLPAERNGNYLLRIEPKHDWEKPLSFEMVPAGRNISVGASPVNFTYYRFSDWEFRAPWQYRFNSTGNHTIRIEVIDRTYRPMSSLNTSTDGVSVQFIILNLDKTNATPWIGMSEGITQMGPENRSAFIGYFNATERGLSSGKYYAIFKASKSNVAIGSGTPANYSANFWTYSPEWQFQMMVSDFDIWLSLPKHSYGFGEWINGTLYAYGPDGEPLQLNASTKLIDSQDGTVISTVNYGSDASGAGAFSVQAPTTSGYYELLTNVTTMTGLNGLSDEWIKVSRLVLEEKRDKDFYAAADSPQFTVKLTNSSGSSIPNATVVGMVDGGTGASYTTITDSSGKATLVFAPSGQWNPGGHDVRFEVRADLGASVVKEEFHSWFEVRGAFMQFFPERGRISETENATFGLFIEGSGASLTNVYVDGEEAQFTTESEQVQGGNFYRIIIPVSGTGSGSWSSGFHPVKASVTVNGKSEEVHSGFSVASVGIFLSMEDGKFDYVAGETARIQVEVFNLTSRQPIPGVNATGYLRTINGGRPISLANWTNTTDGNGKTYLNFTLSKGGNYDVKVVLNISGPEQYMGLRASSGNVWVKIVEPNESSGSFVAGTDTVQIKLNATANLEVKVGVWQSGRRTDLPTPTYAGGFYWANYTISSDSPSGRYFIEASAVNTTSGDRAFNHSFFDVGGYQIRLESGRSFLAKYSPGDALSLVGKVTDATGAPAPGINVTFALGSEGGAESTIGYALTDAKGKASLAYSLSGNTTDGFYYAKSQLTDSPEIADFAPVVVSSLAVRLSTLKDGAEAFSFSLADLVQFNVTAAFSNGTTLESPSSAELAIFDPSRGTITTSLEAGTHPYTATLNFSGQGTFFAVAKVKSGQMMGFDGKPFEISGMTLNLSVSPEAVVANETDFNVTVSSSMTGTATLKIYAPTSSNPVPIYELAGFSVTADTAANRTVLGGNFTLPGKYVVDVKVTNGTNAGFAKRLLAVAPASGEVYSLTVTRDGLVADIHTNGENRTAVVMWQAGSSATNVTSSISLPLFGTGTEYNNSFSVASGTTYFVRLDTPTATDINRTMFVVP